MGATDIIKVGTIISIKLFMVEMKAESDIPTSGGRNLNCVS